MKLLTEFDKICSFENLHLAYLKARKCKRYRKQILEFGYNLEENLLKLEQELSDQSYQHGGYCEFVICDAKKRYIKAALFRDRVVHHAVCNIIEPIFDKGFIYDSYACRAGKGTHKAIKRLENFLRSIKMRKGQLKAQNIYCLQCDVSKYFASIDHKILIGFVEKKIKDKKALWLIQEILSSSYEKGIGVGIPIGNLISQIFANIYLNELDQFVKHKLRIRYYIRYMDDFLILVYSPIRKSLISNGAGKKELHQIKEEIRNFLWHNLKLELHPKKANIFPIYSISSDELFDWQIGITYLGYQIFGTHRLLRKSTIKRFIERTKVYKKMLKRNLITEEKFQNSLQSWMAYAEFGDTYNLRKKLIRKAISQ